MAVDSLENAVGSEVSNQFATDYLQAFVALIEADVSHTKIILLDAANIEFFGSVDYAEGSAIGLQERDGGLCLLTSGNPCRECSLDILGDGF